jgi:hypothetical protein
MISGLVTLETVKYTVERMRLKRLFGIDINDNNAFKAINASERARIQSRFRNSFVNVARPMLAFAQPVDAEQYTTANRTFSAWDAIEVLSCCACGVSLALPVQLYDGRCLQHG